MEGALLLKALAMALVLGLCGSSPTTPYSQEDLAKAQDYLTRLYSSEEVIASRGRGRAAVGSMEKSLREMQEFFGLEVTGKLDSNTVEVMKQPRCGFMDSRARFALFGGRPRWHKSIITYRITDYTSDMSQSEVDATIAKAFRLFSDIIPLDFKAIDSGTADIMILFNAKHHGDLSDFDGNGGTLAHAYSPGSGRGGDTHFDEDEQWSLTSRGVNLLLVAAHEFGHALGLSHSTDKSALMYPIYNYVNTQGYRLPDDDRLGLQELYGIRTPNPKTQPEPKPEPEHEPEPEPEPDHCNRDLVFDAVTHIDNDLYFFKDGHFWRKGAYWDGIFMNDIQSVWPRIKHVDAAYENVARDIAFFFEGDHYWGIRGESLLRGYPKPLTKFGFPSSVTKIDAAVHVTRTGRTLFFVKQKYWSFNERRGKMDVGYPRYIYRDFPGIGYKVDAAFENNGYMYLSTGARQTEYYYPRKRVQRVLLNYSWLDCN